MTLQSTSLDAIEVDALQTDRYLDALLTAVERRAQDVPVDPAVDPALRRAARRLRDELVRTHPSFRFEERLARRLADAAVRMRLATAAGDEAEAALIPFPVPLLADPALVTELANPELAALLGVHGVGAVGRPIAVAPDADAPGRPGTISSTADAARAADSTGEPAGADWASARTAPVPMRPAATHPLLVGGALTSAALSLAGAAFVAWRLTRGAPADPMARAVRAARAARETATTTASRMTATRATAAAAATRRAAATPVSAAARRRRLA